MLSFTVADEMTDQVRVTIGDHTLQNARLVILEVKNSGTVGLDTGSMYKPFQLVAADGTRLRTLQVTRMAQNGEAEELGVEDVTDGQRVVLPKTLLNKGDYLRCSALVEGKPEAVTLHGEAEDFVVARRRPEASDEMVQRMKEAYVQMGKVLALCALVLGAFALATIWTGGVGS